MNLIKNGLILATLLLFSTNSFSGTLSDFENDATKSRDSNRGIYENKNDCSFLDALFSGCGHRESPRKKRTKERHDIKSPASFYKAKALQPYLRADLLFQTISKDVKSLNFSTEIGQKELGFHAAFAKYTELSPNDELNLTQIHGFYRVEGDKNLTLGIGVGVGILKGEKRTTGVSFFVPAKVSLNQHLSLELYSSIVSLNHNPIFNGRLSLAAKYKRFSLLASYLMLSAPNEKIHGPALGISFSTD